MNKTLIENSVTLHCACMEIYNNLSLTFFIAYCRKCKKSFMKF